MSQNQKESVAVEAISEVASNLPEEKQKLVLKYAMELWLEQHFNLKCVDADSVRGL